MSTSNVTNTSVVPVQSVSFPYYDDFSEEKNFHRWLFRPGQAVQARELTQLQTGLQVQFERLGRHIFQNGSVSQGGQLSYDKAISINLATQYIDTDIDVADFIGQTITLLDSSANTVNAYVVAGENANDTEPPTILIKYLSGDEFIENDVIRVSGANTFANIASSSAFSTGLTASISDGIFFMNGFMIRNGRQTIAVEKYRQTANAKVGLEFTETIVTEEDDSSLLEPAQEAGSYQAPGAHRYKIDLTLAKRSLDSVDDDQFIELSRIAEGVQLKDVRIPIYSELEETFARRTYDESGNYTVRPFRLQLKEDSANSANMILRLDPGKAYVFGYEIQTIAPEEIIIPRARETQTESLYDISTAYGNYVNMRNIQGFVDISTMPLADLHCIPWHHVNNANTNTYNSTKIGTTRIRNILYEASSNTSNGQTYRVRSYIFDNRLSNLAANATGGTANTIILNNSTISANNDAYNRALIRLTAGPGEGDQRYIVSYNGSTKTATVSSDFSATPSANTQFSLDFTFAEVESMIIGTGGSTLTANLNICYTCKDDGTSTGNTIIKEPAYESIVFKFPTQYIKDGLTVNNYQYRKVFTNRSFVAGVGTITCATGEAFVGTGTLSESVILENYLVVVKDPDSSGFVAGQIVSFTDTGRSISVTGSTATLDASIAGDFTADIYASVEINSGSETNPKIKTLVSANTTHFSSGASNGSFISSGGSNATIYLNQGQVLIENPNRTPTVADSLYVSDIKELHKIYDLNGDTPSAGASLEAYSDVTTKFRLDDGQRDSLYDHGGIILKSGYSTPRGPLVVCFDYYQHGAGLGDALGYFSVDSYPDADVTEGYVEIPSYTDYEGYTTRLSDVIDFRPKRENGSNGVSYTISGARIPTPNEEYTTTYDYYLARKDMIILTKDRVFKHLKGTSSQDPYYPSDPDDAMILYRLEIPPFTLYPANTVVHFVENKRYTMRDIGKIETRVSNLEYYNLLNTLEKAAADLVIRDVDGLERTKYGIIADKFTGHDIGDVRNPDYRCSMDFNKGELRPFFKQTSHQLNYATGDANHRKNGSVVTLSYTTENFVVQNTASKVENVQPYLIARFVGNAELIPDNDVWVSTEFKPEVTINLTGANDAWDKLATTLNEEVFGTEWENWATHWTGSTLATNVATSRQNIQTTTTTVTNTGIQSRTGISTAVSFDSITESLGERVVDVSIVPFIRSRELFFFAYNLRPNRQIYYFFDEVSVMNYVQKPNLIKLKSSTRFEDEEGFNETISLGANSAQVLLSERDSDSNTILYVANTKGYFVQGQTITGSLSGNSAVVQDYYHFSGNAVGGTTSTINLQVGAANTANYYSGNTIYLVTGKGLGQNSIIQTYNAVTRVATVSPAFSVAPTSNTKYSIGIHKTTRDGSLVGTFIIPSTSTLKFRTGERVLRMIDNSSNDLDNATARAEAKYNASGLLQTKDNLSVSTTVPRVAISQIRETRPVSESTVVSVKKRDLNPPVDPLAQTFFVNRDTYPNGIFVPSVELFFKTKDSTLPVWVEIRPTVNGYPHSSIVLPYSRKTLNPNKIQTSDAPNASNTSTKTVFTFSNPVYLEPGKEYALVVQTNSLNYEVYVSELGKKMIGSNRVISEQPFLGSLFKSQNASTWTPFQYEDLMMVINKCVFTTTPSSIYFNNTIPEANTPMDWSFIQTGELVLSNTNITHSFKTRNYSGGALETIWTDFIPQNSYRHDQRKLIQTAVANSYNLKVTISTVNRDISPSLHLKRFNLMAIENRINNANLTNSLISLTNDGEGYSNTQNVSITISDGGATETANAYVGTIDSGNITSIIIDGGGAYYTETANVVFAGGGATINATAVIASELNASGGPAISRYITRKVILNEGFSAGDIRVYLTVYKPIGTDLHVYAKIRNSNDPTKFEDCKYIKLAQYTPTNRYSSSRLKISSDDLIEYEYRPSLTEDSISYNNGSTTFDEFDEFAIKIILLSNDTIVVPVVHDMRAIALPGG